VDATLTAYMGLTLATFCSAPAFKRWTSLFRRATIN
jgi:hypothetical protein